MLGDIIKKKDNPYSQPLVVKTTFDNIGAFDLNGFEHIIDFNDYVKVDHAIEISNEKDEKKTIYNQLPEVIKSTLLISEGWLVGSSILDLLMGNKPKDYDILVPSRKLFQLATAFLKLDKQIDINTFGGLKFTDTEVEIDIWPENLEHFICNASKFEYAYNLKKSKLITNV